jgi:hypothetical protein
MTLDADKTDPDGKLQPEQIRSVQFVDASAMVAQRNITNSLWLDEVMGVK